MSVPASLIRGGLDLYTGARRGGYGGYGRALSGAGRLASGLAPYAGGYLPAGLGSGLGQAGSALGVLGGLQQGGVQGYGGAAAGAGRLAGNWLKSPGLNSAAGDLNNVLGIYGGLQRGGVQGYGGAAANAMQLAGKAGPALGLLSKGAGQALGTAGGYLAAPLSLYNAISGWQSGDTGGDALRGAEAGASIGSIVPGLGTIIGGLAGGALGALSSLGGSGKVDPENASWEGYHKAYSQDPNVAGQVTNPYASLAGLFDLRKGQITGNLPFYNKYGRMGEQQFTTDMTGKINEALKSGAITPQSSSADIMGKVVNPWIGTMGGNWQDPNKGSQEALLQQMVDQYKTGAYKQDWKAVGGDNPFANLTSFGGTPASPTTATPAASGSSFARSGGPDMPRRGYLTFDDGGSVDSSFGGFDAGGINDYLNDPSLAVGPDPGIMTDEAAANATLAGEPSTGWGSLYNGPAWQTDKTLNSGGSGGWLSALLGSGGGGGSGGGSGSVAGLARQYAPLLPLLSALIGGNRQASAPGMPAGFSSGSPTRFSAPSMARTQTRMNPNTDWYTYGQHPEANFFQNNALPYIAGYSPAGTAPAADGGAGATTQPAPTTGKPVMSRGGALGSLFDSSAGDSFARGEGDGTSDDIPAKLSDGEYVMDAGTVSMLGNGSNEAGARALDKLRANVRKHAGRKMVKGKQFMKAKSPEKYLKSDGGGKGES